jgi:hypothetical protein
MELTLYRVITWPDIQDLMVEDGFEEHSYLINDNKGMEDYGSSAYFVDVDWYQDLIDERRNCK